MNSRPQTQHDNESTCVHPDCLFKEAGFKARQFTELLLKQLREVPMENIDPEFKRILQRPQCLPCACRVIRGGKACLTEAEQAHLRDVGRWHQRRQRRSTRWGCLSR